MTYSPPSARPGRRKTFFFVTVARALLAVIFVFPLVFMVVSSFKPDRQIFADLGSFAAFVPTGHLSLDNYAALFVRVPIGRFFLNSVVVSGVTVVLGLIVNSMAAFALSRTRLRGRRVILVLIIATLTVPFEALALPLVWWVNQLPWLTLHGFTLTLTTGWLDTYQVQIVPFIANAFSIFLFYQYFQSIPRELDEAAKLDGAGWFRIYRSVVIPLCGPAIATVAILTFLPAWNSYLWPLMVVQSQELRPVMVGIDYFFQLNVSWGQLLAYASLITVPVIALFVVFQRAFVNSIAATGVKG